MTQPIPSQIGRYRILEAAGEWARGWFFRGRDDLLERDVLIKTLSTEAARDPQARARLEREARIAARLFDPNHPNIIEIKELAEHEGIPFTVFEALEGKSLLQLMNTGISLKTGLPVMLQVLDGLAFMHRSGIIHRDIKPSCIFVGVDGRVKVIDLFSAKLMDPDRSVAATGRIIGTPSYMSPNQALGLALDGRSDLFSLGCVLYEMIAGRQPFQGDTPVVALFKVIQDSPDMGPFPNGPEWERLRAVVARALEKKPEDRYPDAGAMRVDLELAMKELGPRADWTPPRSGSADPARA